MNQPSQPPRLCLDAHPDWKALYDLAWKTAKQNVTDPGLPGWKPQICCVPQLGVTWVWDSCLMTLFTRYGNGIVPVMNNVDNLYRLQREDGLIGMAYHMAKNELAYGERVNPPLFAWAEHSYCRCTGDTSRLGEALPRLVRLFDWYKQNRRRDNGLYWFEDSGSSGMDNSPRSGYCAQYLNGSDIAHVDLAAQQAHAAECIAALARLIGDTATAQRFESERAELADLVNQHHWNTRSCFYFDVFENSYPSQKANHLNHRTIASFWPLFAGICSTEQAHALIRCLFDPDDFWTPHPIASLSKKDPNYDPSGGYWLGGVWAPVNYMISCALRRYGRQDLSRQLATAHLDGMVKVMQNADYGGIWECYAPEEFRPGTQKTKKLARPNFVGWSGLGPIAMVIEDILGLELEAPANRITWTITEQSPHGIEDLPFDGDRLSLWSSGLGRGQTEIRIQTKRPFHLRIEIPDWNLDIDEQIPAGNYTRKLTRPT